MDINLTRRLFEYHNHGTQHRSEAALIVSHHGYSPGDLDLVFFLMAR